jgi:arsenate reductase (glutaredoxin)
MIKGTVKFFNGTKGFGFITPDDGSKEVFVPSATVTASATGQLKAGQRVCFEAEQEAKGPKAVKLTLLDEEPKETVRANITIYHETDCEDSADVIATLAAAGYVAREVDYVATPPSREELKRLSVMLRESNQSLARRYEPLFMELQLDDRFISENEFLTAIAEHPTLINGPILVSASKAQICKTAEDVYAFLGNGELEEKRSKGISPRMAAMILGRAVPPPPPMPPAPEKEARRVDAIAKSDESEILEMEAKAKPEAKPKKGGVIVAKKPPKASVKRVAAAAKPAKIKSALKPAKRAKK